MQLNQDQQRMFEHAIGYAGKGWHILPVSKMTQKPLIRDWLTKASSDRSQVVSWFSDYPAMNIGVLTGEKSGFSAVGLHMRDNIRGFNSLKNRFGKRFDWDLKKWLVGVTATGGFHFLVQWDSEHPLKTESGILPGVDTRGHGGWIMAPPSTVSIDNKWVAHRWNDPDLPICPFNEYQWLQEIAELKDEPSEPSKFTAEDIWRTMTGLQEGGRDEMLHRYVEHLKAHRIDMGLALGFIEVACERAKPPFDKTKAAAMVRQAYNAQQPKKDKKRFMSTFKLEQGRLKRHT